MFGGSIDNWRIGQGATMYWPVQGIGALFPVGDPHASQGDSELCGPAIESSLTGTFQLILQKKATLAGRSQVPDGNWGVYGIVKKGPFAGRSDS